MSQETDGDGTDDNANANQHYVTKSFVRDRFGENGFVQRYSIEQNSWKPNASPRFIFSGRGYTQLLANGQPLDNSLEDSFGKLETKLPTIFPVLDNAASKKETPVPKDIFQDLLWYCAYLNHLSPFAKAKAPADYVFQLDMDLQHGNIKFLHELGMLEQDIATMQRLHAAGSKFILQGDNYIQWVFRTQFVRNAKYKAKMFMENVKWTVYNSPLELPISDIPLIDFPEANKATLFILPISPERVLIGRLEWGNPPVQYSDTIIYGGTLTPESAEDVLDIICLSGIKTLACKSKMDIPTFRDRGNKKKIGFTKIKDIDAVLSAGEKPFNPYTLRHIPVNKEVFVKYINSFVGK